MENIRKAIEIVFRRISLEKIYDSLISMTDFYRSVIGSKKEYLYNNISEEAFLNASNNIFRNISNDEVKNIYRKFFNFNDELNSDKYSSNEVSNIFDLLCIYGEKVLTRNNNVPVCKYEHLLNWWKMSNKMGQDIITMAYMAKNNITGAHSVSFAYPVAISNDNNRLNTILDKGLAENHFHLNGSSATFPLSWAYLMNHFNQIDRKINKSFGNILDKDTYGSKEIKWNEYIKDAAVIRVWLFNKIISNKSSDASANKCLEKYNSTELLKFIKDNLTICQYHASSAIDRARYFCGVKDKKTGLVLDYASPTEYFSQPFEMSALTGERFFLYSCFRKIYLNEFDSVQMQMFYFYLAIKSAFRGEMIQSNDRVGFDNFRQYQDRKDIIFDDDKLYERCAYNLAVNQTFNSHNIKYLEARIVPKTDSEKLIESIYEKDKNIMGKDPADDFDTKPDERNNTVQVNKDNFYYVFHFIKGPDKPSNNVSKFPTRERLSIPCRNSECRKKAHRQAAAIYRAVNEKNALRSRILGIDAASSEIGCRPEVFASEFRYLKHMVPSYHHCEFVNEQKLCINATYHVGEDFYDIIDGLRAIDEAILFLNLRINDRLGHALALGTDPACYYQKRGFTVVMPKQDMLDNLMWFVYKADSLNAELTASDRKIIMNEFYFLLADIYGKRYDDSSVNFFDYVNSWQLRGDNPELYHFGKCDSQSITTYYRESCINNLVNQTIRNNAKAAGLYSDYHFNLSVRKNGDKQTSFKLTKTMIKTLSQLQHNMQLEIAAKGISIECNPSSNYVIGNFKRFDKHPILSFYNKHLGTTDQDSAQLSVSINTDDQGVFDTNLKNEYSVMAAALEQITDENQQHIYSSDNVYHWIDDVREMGICQSFGNYRNR